MDDFLAVLYLLVVGLYLLQQVGKGCILLHQVCLQGVILFEAKRELISQLAGLATMGLDLLL